MTFKHIVVMPKMSMTMETGELINYHVSPGQHVKSGDLLFEVMTDKIDMEVDSPADGVITTLIGEVGATIEIGKPVLEMETETQVISFDFSESPADIPTEVAPVPAQPVITQPVAVIPVPVTPPAPVTPAVVLPSSVLAVPKARAMAAEKGIDIRTVVPTGPDKTIMAADVANAQQNPELAKRRAGNQALIAARIAEGSLIPQATFNKTFAIENKLSDAKIMKTWARVLKEALSTEIGVAKVTPSIYGSALPVYKNIESMDEASLASLITSTTASAANGKVPLAMLSGASSTLFDLRELKLESGRLGLLPGQSSTLTIGSGKKGKISLSLTVDLRVFDLYDAAALLARFITIL
jgi:pyruvate dehydrogenase E2 component (dihydrolipoamide acetyltransferase)